MNSLLDLNNYNTDLSLSYTDLRLGNVIFSTLTPTDKIQTVNEGVSFLSDIGIEIVDVINYPISLPTYTIDVRNLSGVTVSWDVIPPECTVTSITDGVYKISGIQTKDIWDIIKYARIQLPSGVPNSFFGTWSYTAKIDYIDEVAGAKTKSWNVTVNVLDTVILSKPLDTVFYPNIITAISNPPQIPDFNDTTYPGATWTIVATPNITTSINSFSSTSPLGGTFNFNPTTKVFTIVGTRTQVNSHLSLLTINATLLSQDFELTYVSSNNQTSLTDSVVQIFRNADIQYLSNPSSAVVYYNEDADSTFITNAPQITDYAYEGSEAYFIEVTSSNPDSIVYMTSSGVGGSTNWVEEDKKLIIAGTKSQVNERLNNIEITISADYISTFNLIYNLETPLFYVATKYQLLVCNADSPEIANMDISRSYISSNKNFIFSTNTPYINDADTDPDAEYTINLTSNLGEFSTSETNSFVSFSYTGTRTQVNALFSTIIFYPNPGISSNGTFTYKQYKNGNIQVTANVILNGTVGTYTPRYLEFTTSQTWTPTVADVKYGKITRLLLVGGGAGGRGGTWTKYYSNTVMVGFGGGGGGQVQALTPNISLNPNTTYSIIVGNGGLGSANKPVEVANNVFEQSPDGSAGGGNTSVFGYTANGAPPLPKIFEGTNVNYGGDCGDGIHIGGNRGGTNIDGIGGGGGGGTNGNGQSGSGSSGGTTGYGGNGGAGIADPWFSLKYGSGGGGGSTNSTPVSTTSLGGNSIGYSLSFNFFSVAPQQPVTVTVTTTNVPNGTVVPWKLLNSITYFNQNQGSITIFNNSAQINLLSTFPSDSGVMIYMSSVLFLFGGGGDGANINKAPGPVLQNSGNGGGGGNGLYPGANGADGFVKFLIS